MSSDADRPFYLFKRLARCATPLTEGGGWGVSPEIIIFRHSYDAWGRKLNPALLIPGRRVVINMSGQGDELMNGGNNVAPDPEFQGNNPAFTNV
jgi:hypothetical protein